MRIFIPRPIRINPPINSEACLLFMPSLEPILNPTIERRAVIIPIVDADLMMSILRKARPTPTARASMDVAIPILVKLPKSKPWFTSQ